MRSERVGKRFYKYRFFVYVKLIKYLKKTKKNLTNVYFVLYSAGFGGISLRGSLKLESGKMHRFDFCIFFGKCIFLISFFIINHLGNADIIIAY